MKNISKSFQTHSTLKTFIIIFLIFFIILVVITWRLLNGYFEQDEWLGLGSAMRSNMLPWWNPFVARSSHFSPSGIIFWRTLYETFHLQAHFYFLIELMIHAAVSALAYILAFRLSKNKKIALLTSLLFLLNSRAHQAFTHLAIFHVTTTSMFFIMLFFVYLTDIKSKFFTYKNILILLLIFFIAISFREEGYIIAPLFISFIILLDRLKINKNNLKHYIMLLGGLFIALYTRYFAQSLNSEAIPVQYQITGDGSIYNLSTIPFKLLAQNLIYSERIVQFYLNYFQKIFPGTINNVYTDLQPLMDSAFILFSVIFGAIYIFSIWKYKQKRIISLILFLFSWILFHSFMLSFVGRSLGVLEPRYLYFSSFPVFLLFSILMYSIFTSKSKNNMISYIKKSTVLIIICLMFIASYKEIRIAVNKMSSSGIAKKKVLNSLIDVHPRLMKNQIIFIKCKEQCYRNSEFGISTENVLPFSLGPGLPIMVTYASVLGEEEEWAPFLTIDFLAHYLTEGYKEIGDRSFGYFVDQRKLELAIAENNIPLENIIALEYDEENFSFRDISDSFRETLSEN